MVAFDEEIFGPVFSVIRAKSENDAIDLANNSPFGLELQFLQKIFSKVKKLLKIS